MHLRIVMCVRAHVYVYLIMDTPVVWNVLYVIAQGVTQSVGKG